MEHSELQNSASGFYIFADDDTSLGTGKPAATISVELSKAGAAYNAVAPTITDRGDGHYWVAPIAAHRDTLGRAAWRFSAAGAIIAPRFEKVVAVNDQDADFGLTFAKAGDEMALVNDAITSGKIEATAVDEIRDGLLDRVLPGNHEVPNTPGVFLQQLDALITSRAEPGDEMGLTASTLTQLFSDADVAALVDSVIARVETDLDPADVSVSAIATASATATRDAILNRFLSGNHDIGGTLGKLAQNLDAAVSTLATLAQQNTLLTRIPGIINADGSGFSALPWNPDWDVEVQSEVQDAIEVNHLDHLFAAAYDPANKPGSASGLWNLLLENDSGLPRFLANVLEEAPLGGGGGGFGQPDRDELVKAVERISWALCVLTGEINNSGSDDETFTEDFGDGTQYTVTGSGLTADGNRGPTTYSKV